MYLKNGSELHGLVVERVPGSHLVIQMVGGSSLKVPEADIEKLSQEKPDDMFIFRYLRNNKKGTKGPVTGRQPGLAFQWGFTLTPSTDNWGTLILYPGLNMKAMYNLQKGWSLGGGMAVTPYGPGGTVPFFGEVQKVLGPQGQVAHPYLFGQLGYGYGAWENWNTRDFSGGVMSQLGAGYMIQTRRRTEWLFSLAFTLQQASFREVPWDFPSPGELPLQNSMLPTVQLNLGMSL